MTNVIDWILDLFRDPVQAQAFITDPERAMAQAGVQGVTAAQVNAVAATVAPAAVLHGGGNPIHGLQQAVAETHGIAFVPQTEAFSNNDTFSHNNPFSNNDTLSHNDVLSPNAGHDVQQGGVNLDFGDFTFGDKNTASDGSVINTGNAGDIDATNVRGDGNITGDGNVGANTGDVLAGAGSNVQAGGAGNDLDSHGNVINTGHGDVISGNEGPVVKTGDIDTSGGGASAGHGGHGGILGGGGDGGNAAGGAGGGVVIAPTQTTTVGGDQTSTHVGGDVSGSGGIDASHTDDHTSIDDHSSVDDHSTTTATTPRSTRTWIRASTSGSDRETTA
jgi:hypothetical protein